MDPHSRIREKDTNYRNEMLPKALRHLLQRSRYKWESGEQNQTSHWALKDLLTTVKKRKLRWHGHKTRSTGLAKMILQGTVGGRRRGRQKKRWVDNVTEWTGLKLGEALRKAENREEWRTVVARSSLVPQRSTRLWDKWSAVKWRLLYMVISEMLDICTFFTTTQWPNIERKDFFADSIFMIFVSNHTPH